jgi:chorismate dehydratase
MTHTVTVGRISYMNVAPVYYGLDNGLCPDWMEVVSGPPSFLNRSLADGALDISPVSSAAYARHPRDWVLLPGLSISCFGAVMSVLLVSRYPLDCLDGRTVLLTDESATAAALLRLLFAGKGIRPRFRTGKVRRPQAFNGDGDAALVIGDAALREDWRGHFPHVLDLGQLWWDLTGRPFVFAVWAARREFAESCPDRVAAVSAAFRQSKAAGLAGIDGIIPAAAHRLRLDHDACRRYYRRLHYDLTPPEIEGLGVFFGGLHRHHLIGRPVSPLFFHEGRVMNAA